MSDNAEAASVFRMEFRLGVRQGLNRWTHRRVDRRYARNVAAAVTEEIRPDPAGCVARACFEILAGLRRRRRVHQPPAPAEDGLVYRANRRQSAVRKDFPELIRPDLR